MEEKIGIYYRQEKGYLSDINTEELGQSRFF